MVMALAWLGESSLHFLVVLQNLLKAFQPIGEKTDTKDMEENSFGVESEEYKFLRSKK